MRTTCLLLAAVLFVPSPPHHELQAADESSALKPGTHLEAMVHDGIKRTYRLYVPRSYDGAKPVPLVIGLHGSFTDGRIMAILTAFSIPADKYGFAVVYPDGLNTMWRFGGKEDVGFIAALIDELVGKKLVDPTRVYSTGISAGGYMSNKLGCDLGHRLAAIAPVCGTMQKKTENKPVCPMPVLYIHGTDDRITGYDGNLLVGKHAVSLSAEEQVAWWAKYNRCAEKPKVEMLPDKIDDGTAVERWTYEPAKDGAPVIFYKIKGGGHTWPGAPFQPEALLGKTCRDFKATEVIWEFFSRQPPRKQPK